MRPAIFFDLTHTLLEKVNGQYYLYSDALDTLKALLVSAATAGGDLQPV
jgi:hypothetical protein